MINVSSGYCFGAPFVFDLAAKGAIVAGSVFRVVIPYSRSTRACIAGAIAHPAFLEESHFEKMTRTFRTPRILSRCVAPYSHLPTTRQVLSSSPARVSPLHIPSNRLSIDRFDPPPSFVATSEEDFTFSLEARRRAEDILVRNKTGYFIQVFSGVAHGFAVRGNPDVPDERAFLLHSEWCWRLT